MWFQEYLNASHRQSSKSKRGVVDNRWFNLGHVIERERFWTPKLDPLAEFQSTLSTERVHLYLPTQRMSSSAQLLPSNKHNTPNVFVMISGDSNNFPSGIDNIQFNWIWYLFFLNQTPPVGSRGGWSLSQRSSGERRGTPWTGRQSITGPHRDKRDTQPHTLTLKDNFRDTS